MECTAFEDVKFADEVVDGHSRSQSEEGFEEDTEEAIKKAKGKPVYYLEEDDDLAFEMHLFFGTPDQIRKKIKRKLSQAIDESLGL
jgi:hypothetical protein